MPKDKKVSTLHLGDQHVRSAAARIVNRMGDEVRRAEKENKFLATNLGSLMADFETIVQGSLMLAEKLDVAAISDIDMGVSEGFVKVAEVLSKRERHREAVILANAAAQYISYKDEDEKRSARVARQALTVINRAVKAIGLGDQGIAALAFEILWNIKDSVRTWGRLDRDIAGCWGNCAQIMVQRGDKETLRKFMPSISQKAPGAYAQIVRKYATTVGD